MSERPSAYSRLNELLAPKPAVLDLDAFVQTVQTSEVHDSLEDIPAWMTALTEQQASRIYQECTSGRSQEAILSILRETRPPLAIMQDGPSLIRLVHQLTTADSAVQRQLRLWIRRHNDGLKETKGTIIYGPQFLRTKEQQALIKPTLREIATAHFGSGPEARNGTLLDLGAWDGSVTVSLHDHFSRLIAVEQNEDRYQQLSDLSLRFKKIAPVEMDIKKLVEQNANIPVDMVLMSHLLYFFKKDDKDIELLNWVSRQLRNNGLMAIVLNDTLADPGTRAHVRRSFHATENTPDIQKYKRWFHEHGFGVRLLRPELQIQASSKDAVIALTDIVRFMVPGEVRQNEQAIQAYVKNLRDESGQYLLRYRLSILAAGSTVATQPDEWSTFNRLYDQELYQPVPKTVTSTVTQVRSVLISQTTQEWPNLRASLAGIAPQVALDLLDRILESTQWGSEDKALSNILDQCGIPRAMYNVLCQRRNELEKMVKEGTPTIAGIFAIKHKRAPSVATPKSRRTFFREPPSPAWHIPPKPTIARFTIPETISDDHVGSPTPTPILNGHTEAVSDEPDSSVHELTQIAEVALALAARISTLLSSSFSPSSL